MSTWNKKRDPEPDRKDAAKFKEWIQAKYIDRKFAEKAEESSSDSE